MTKNNYWLLAALVILAALYVVFFTSWLRPKKITVFDTTRPMTHRGRNTTLILFGINPGERLTEVKVVSLDSLKTNSLAPAVWHLVSDSNSVPVQRFAYGQRIGGMRPPIRGEVAEPLETNVMYRLFVVAGGVKGQHDFEIK